MFSKNKRVLTLNNQFYISKLKKCNVLKLIFLFKTFELICFSIYSEEIKRSHIFPRPIAMGQAYTAVGGNEFSVSYNPAGLYQKNADWAFTPPFLFPLPISISGTISHTCYGIPSIILSEELAKLRETSETSSFESINTEEDYNELLGKRFYLEIDCNLAFYNPNEGTYHSISNNTWLDIRVENVETDMFGYTLEEPTVSIDLISEKQFEFAKSIPIGNAKIGFSFRAIQREGVSVDKTVEELTLDESNDLNQELERIFENDQEVSVTKLSGDIGFLYTFEHKWKPTIGLAILNMGHKNFDEIGKELKQFNSIGIAIHPRIYKLHTTFSLDYHDFNNSYFSHTDILRRIAIGIEASVGIKKDTSRFAAFQIGMRSLQPSFGLLARVFFTEIGFTYWKEEWQYLDEKNIDGLFLLYWKFRF